jgi:GNAT superfamily N-acetyltransferase
MNNQIKIQNATKKDINFIYNGTTDICKIEKQKPEKKAFTIKQLKQAIQTKKVRVAHLNKKPVGFVQFTFSNKSPYGLEYGRWERKFCWIEWMYITKKNRRQGIGILLKKDLEKICKKKKVNEIMLDVFEVNKKAKKFYIKNGFNDVIHIMTTKIN